MKVIVAGSRTIEDYDEVVKAIKESQFTITELVSGNANGVDKLGERWAQVNGVPIKRFPVAAAQWRQWGKSAGYYRNVDMAQYADALILIWTGDSPGSAMMKRIARLMKMPIYEHVVDLAWF